MVYTYRMIYFACFLCCHESYIKSRLRLLALSSHALFSLYGPQHHRHPASQMCYHYHSNSNPNNRYSISIDSVSPPRAALCFCHRLTSVDMLMSRCRSGTPRRRTYYTWRFMIDGRYRIRCLLGYGRRVVWSSRAIAHVRLHNPQAKQIGGGKVMLTSRRGKRSADLVKSVKAEDSPYRFYVNLGFRAY